MTDHYDYQYAHLTFQGDFSAHEVTLLTGTPPTRAWDRTDKRKTSDTLYGFSLWSLDSRLDRSIRLEYHIEDVLAQMDVNEPAFLDVCKRLKGQIGCMGSWVNDGYPGVHLHRTLIAKLAHYGLDIDMDYYFK